MLKNLHLANTLKLDFLSGSYARVNMHWLCRGTGYPFTRLYYIYSGSAVLSCNGQTVTMTPGNLYILPTNLPVSYHCPDQMEQLFLHVTLTTPDGFDMLSMIPKICQLPCPQPFWEQFKNTSYFKDYGELLRFKTFISQILTDCLLAENIPIPIKPYSQEVLQAISYMQNNLTIQLSGEQIAQAIYISPSRLHKRFKAETGLTLGAYLDKLIFSRATQLLVDRHLSIKEISQQLGFCDQYYFSRRFKAQMGTTPSHYRKYHLA